MKTMICAALATAVLLAAGPASATGFGIDPMGVNGVGACTDGGSHLDPNGCPAMIDEGPQLDPHGATANADQGIAIDPNGGWLDSFGAWLAGLFS